VGSPTAPKGHGDGGVIVLERGRTPGEGFLEKS